MAFICLGANAGRNAAALYYCSWFVTQLLCETLKMCMQRPRPAVALAGELELVPRGSTQLARFVCHPRNNQAYMSCPSSDAAGSAVFATSLAKSAELFEPEKTAIVVLAVLVCTCFGRVYFHTNHVLDTAVGL